MPAQAPRPSPSRPSAFERAVPGVAFLSGAAVLVYESLWVRSFGLVFGNTTQAASVVLATFMGGLLLGSVLCGRIAFRRVLRAYALLEVGIGLAALLTLPLLRHLPAWYSAALRQHVQGGALEIGLKVLLAAAVILPATVLAGATLPVLVEFWSRTGRNLHASFGSLYLVNTLGAAAGVFASTFFLVPRLGLSRTFLGAVLVNLSLGALTWTRRGSGRDTPATASPRPRRPEGPAPPTSWTLPLVAAGTGFCSFALEVLWMRSFALVVGSSVYAFNLMLLAILLGIVLGSQIYRRLWPRVRRPQAWLAAFLLFSALAILTDVAVIGRLPALYFELMKRTPVSFTLTQALQFALCFGTMSLVTAPMGFVFPLLTHLPGARPQSAQEIAARLYAWNTFGAVAGSLATGFALIPAVGLQPAFAFAAGLPLLLGIGVWPARRFLPRKALALVAGTVAVVLLARAYRPWDRNEMTGGVYLLRGDVGRDTPQPLGLHGWLEHWKRVSFYREGREAVVAVKESDENRALFVNGKADAGTGEDVITQKMLAHVPLLLHAAPRSALVIGWGSGCTAGTAGLYALQQLDCVEIEPAVYETASLFSSVNHDVQRDPRFRLVLQDGRNFLLQTEHRYDVIISEPSNPWISGVANLFTWEFYRSVRDHLQPDGIFCQWLHYYNMGADDLKVQFHTFCESFPHASLWIIPDARNRRRISGDFLLLGSLQPLALDYQRVHERLQDARIAADLAASGMRDELAFLCNYTADRADLQRSYSAERLNTDDFPYLEFSAPRALQRSRVEDHRIALEHFKAFDAASSDTCPPFIHDPALAAGADPKRRAAAYRDLAEQYSQKLLLRRAERLLLSSLAFDPGAAATYLDLARLYDFEQRRGAAREQLEKALTIDPELAPARGLLQQIETQPGKK